MRICDKCGNVNEDRYSFCPRCGTPIAHSTKVTPRFPASPSPAIETINTLQEPALRAKPTNYFWLFVGLTFSALVIVFALVISNSNSRGTPSSSSPRNTSISDTPIEQQLAVIDGVGSDAIKVNRFRSLLTQLRSEEHTSELQSLR